MHIISLDEAPACTAFFILALKRRTVRGTPASRPQLQRTTDNSSTLPPPARTTTHSHPSLAATRHVALHPLRQRAQLRRIHSGLPIGAAVLCRRQCGRPGAATPRARVRHRALGARDGTTRTRTRAAIRLVSVTRGAHCGTRLSRAHVAALLVPCATSPALRCCRRFKTDRRCSATAREYAALRLCFDRSSKLIRY